MVNITSKKQGGPGFIGPNKNTPKNNNNLWVGATEAQIGGASKVNID